MIILPCLPIFFTSSYLSAVFLLGFVFFLIYTIVRRF